MREALFLSIWLRRQEAQAHQVRILAQGLADITSATESGKVNTADIFQKYIEALFPWAKGQQEAQDQKMKEALKRETARGILTFRPVEDRFLKQKLKTMQMPDDFKKRLATKRGSR